MRIGPYVMPKFSQRAISNRQLDSIVRYVEFTKSPTRPGGWGLGFLGPVPEGLVTWFVAIPLLLALCLLLGKQVPAAMSRAAEHDRLGARPARGPPPARTEAGGDAARAGAAAEPGRGARRPRACSGSRRSRALGFILVYAFGSELPDETQLLGATLGLAFLFLAAALVVVGLKLVPTEEIAEEYPPHEHPGEQQVIAELVDESGTRFTRRRLFKLGLLGAGGTLGLALLTPAVVLRAALPRRRLPPHAVAARAGGSWTRTAARTRRPTSRRTTSTSRSPRG